MARLVIEVELGNDAMQSADDASRAISEALRRQASAIHAPLGEGDGGKIRDDNGNTVGTWEIRP